MTFTPGSKGGALGSGLLNSGINKIHSFLTLVRLWVPPSQECPLTCSLVVVLSKLVTNYGQSSLVKGTSLPTLPCMAEGRELTFLFLGIVIPVGTWAKHRVCLECAGTVTEPASWASPARGGSRVPGCLLFMALALVIFTSLAIPGLGPKTSPCPLPSVWA